MKTTRADIEAALWRGANTFRGIIDAANYKDYVLSMLFVKYLSDTYKENVENLKSKYPDEQRFERAKSRLPFALSEEQTFDYLYENRFNSEIGQKINAALRAIEDNNPQLQGVFRSVDFNSEPNLGNPKQKATTLRNLLEDFKSLDLRPSMIEVKENQVASDVLGDAFEYMIGEFASQAGKKAGSFFTPMMVSELMAHIAKPKQGDSIYDPTSGSCSLLIRAAKYAGVKQVSIYGQEMNGSSWSMGKMNMFIHDIMDSKIAWGDTLANPAHLDSDGNLMKFNVVVANMPFSQDKWAEGFNPGGESDGKEKIKDKKFKMEAKYDPYNRFDWGIPPSSKGDWAFLLHMINSLQPDGRMVAVVPHGVLFRGASEGVIRKRVIEENLLDAVIGLPENLFFGTSIPACLLVIKKNRSNKDVLFIDASGEGRYIKDKTQNKLTQKNIDDILDIYNKRETVDKFSYVATFEEIKENEFNLNIPRYVDTFEEEEIIDITQVQTNIKNIKSELEVVEKDLAEALKELGLEV